MPFGHRAKTPTVRVAVRRDTAEGIEQGRDDVVVEEPMEIRVGAVGATDDELAPLAVTMRTPGNDFELATGFVVSEGVASTPADIRGVAYCGLPADRQEYNVVTVRLGTTPDLDRHRRNSYMTSSCGVCGKASIDAVEVACHRSPVSDPVPPAVIAGLTERLGDRQRWFATTGGLHAAGLFDLSGSPLVVREDVGRHNAVDKVIGWAAMAGALPADHRVLVVSGRASFEIVQKAAVAGIATVVAVSAPSSLAIDAARRLGVTLVGFARGDRFTTYSGAVGDGAGGAAPAVEMHAGGTLP
jgi:FdhD protein